MLSTTFLASPISLSAPRRGRLSLALAVAAVLGAASAGRAATFTWLPTDVGPFNWDNAGAQVNWTPVGFPNAAMDVANVTSDLIAPQSIDLNVPVTLGVLNIGDADASASFTIGPGLGGSFLFNNGLAPAQINQAAGSAGDTLAVPIATAGELSIANLAAPSLVLNGPISSSATTDFQSVSVTGGNVRFAGDISDGITGEKIAIAQAGTGTISLLGNNTFTGGVTLGSGGILNIGSATALGATASTLTIEAGSTITNLGGFPIFMVNNNQQIWDGDFSFGGSFDLDLGTGAAVMTGSRQVTVTSNNLTVGGVVTDGGNGFTLTKAGTGTLTLGGQNTYSGDTTVNAGSLTLTHGGALGTGSSVTVVAGAALTLSGGIVVTGKTAVLSGEGIALGGALRSIGDNVWGGNIAANTSGILRVVSVSGTLTLGGNVVTAGTQANGFVLHGNGIVNGVISGDGSLTRSNNDGGTWTFNSANTYTGNTAISNGAIRLGNTNAIQNSAVTLGALATNGLQFADGIGSFHLVSLATASQAAGFALTDIANAPVNLTVGSAGTNTAFVGTVSGLGSLTKVGGGGFTLSGANTFAGGVTINGGILAASDATNSISQNVSTVRNGLGTGTVTLASGSTLNLRANGTADGSQQTLVFGNTTTLTGPATISVDRQAATGGTVKTLTLGSLSLGTDALTVTSGNSFGLQFGTTTLTANATINFATATGSVILGDVVETGGARSLTKTGAGRLTIIGNVANTGGISVATGGGTLQIGNGGYTGTLSGDVANEGNVTFSRADTSTYGGVISGAGSLTKVGSGTQILTGANTYGGATTMNNGTLLLDFANTASVLNPASPVTFGGGALYIKGASTGTTAQTLGNLTTTISLPGLIVLDPNGGAGTTLTLGNTWTLGGSNVLHIDLSRGGTLTSSPTVTSGVVTGGGIARVTTTGTDGRTYFATVSGGNIGPQTALTALPTTGGNAGVNYNVSGDVVTTGAVSTGTLRIDTTAGPGSLDIAGGSLTFGRTAMLMDGDGDFEIKRTAGAGTVANVVIHHYGKGTLTISAPFAAAFTKGGAGLLVGTMPIGNPGAITINEGIYRIGVTTAAPTQVTLSGGIIEFGSGDFVFGIGAGAGQVRILADGGFSAFGATRIVNLGNAGAAITWDQANFLPGNATLLLSSSRSNATVDFQNPLLLGGITRTVRVFDGTAAVDAQISGALGGTGGFVKTGPGSLLLSGTSGFTGITSVREGALLVNGSLAGAVNVVTGTLQGNGDGFSTGVIAGAVTVGNGIGTGDAILSPGNSIGSLTTASALSLASDAAFRLEIDSQFGIADQFSANEVTIAASANFQALDIAAVGTVLAPSTTFVILNNTGFGPINGVFGNLADGALVAIGMNLFQANYGGGNGNDLALIAVPEPSSLTALLGSCGALLGISRRRTKMR